MSISSFIQQEVSTWPLSDAGARSLIFAYMNYTISSSWVQIPSKIIVFFFLFFFSFFLTYFYYFYFFRDPLVYFLFFSFFFVTLGSMKGNKWLQCSMNGV
jgi:hypothetical protein